MSFLFLFNLIVILLAGLIAGILYLVFLIYRQKRGEKK